MEQVIIAVGSNVGNRHKHLTEAFSFLQSVSRKEIQAASIYLTQPVGPSRRYFLNSVLEIHTDQSPQVLIRTLKNFEQGHGRSNTQPRWSPRTIDLDIIAFGNLVIQKESLIIPHPEYCHRLFVLIPLKELHPQWEDPKSGRDIDHFIEKAPPLQIRKTELSWYYEE